MTRVCCQELLEIDSFPKQPFTRVIALSWDGGLATGVMACGACGAEYSFESGDTDDEDDARTFALARVPDGTIEDIVDLFSEYLEPEWPIWRPDWRFGTLEIRTALEENISEILEEAEPPELKVLWSLTDNTVLAAAHVDDD